MSEWYDNGLNYVASRDEIDSLLPIMKATKYTMSIPLEQWPKYQKEGWSITKEFKRTLRIERPKPHDDLFEDYVWQLFALMGFGYLSKDRHKFEVDIDNGDKKQIDVFGIDEDVVILAECKSAEKPKTKRDFRSEIDHIASYKSQVPKHMNTHFSGYKPKYIFFFCTENYDVSVEDQNRLKVAGILWFDKKKIDYYMELVSQIGVLCKYQFLGEILQGKDVPGMKDNRVAAIKSKLGRYVCYTMMIEPKSLLKISYVLHRSENVEMKGTYQRYIKKTRIGAIKDYIENGGYFPNSIIINFENNLSFEPVAKDLQCSENSTLGRLILPSKYRSAFIIDGQHRLYGYAGANNVEKAVIPVVAFEQVSPEDQTAMFVDINNKAVAVKRSLIESLNCELYWDSPNPKYALTALRSMLAIKLTNDPASPLLDCIFIGEKAKSDSSKITLSYFIDNGIKHQKYFVKEFHKNGTPLVYGPLYDGDLSGKSLKKAFHIFTWYFGEIKKNCVNQWDDLLTNVIICSLSEMMYEFISEYEQLNPGFKFVNRSAKEIESCLQQRVNLLCTKIATKTSEDIERYQDSSYGYGGVNKTKRFFEEMIHESDDSFCPDGLEKWICEKSGMYREATEKMIQELSIAIVGKAKEILIRKYSNTFFFELPDSVTSKMKKRPQREIDLEDIREIALNLEWKDCFDVFRDRSMSRGTKEEKTKYLNDLVKVRQTITKDGTITEEQYSITKKIYDWYFKETESDA